MSVQAEYLLNYERIAADHVAHWRKTGRNPFQTPEANAEPVSWTEAYDYVHLRILDEGTMRLLFTRVFPHEVLETLIGNGSLHLVVRK